uniref:Uncharacterized protein n=1 Tax=Tetradesmus obliquus TaxID=3088 RepID=A0A383WN37_TETOB|eukprot:jgi/Sobl393_1/19461/SZX78693.1
MWYELEHLKEYATNVVIITCTNPPSVAEGWNAVFQAFPDEPWGVYCARDTAWMPGSLRKLAWHMWGATNNNSLEIGLVQCVVNSWRQLGVHAAAAAAAPAADTSGDAAAL